MIFSVAWRCYDNLRCSDADWSVNLKFNLNRPVSLIQVRSSFSQSSSKHLVNVVLLVGSFLFLIVVALEFLYHDFGFFNVFSTHRAGYYLIFAFEIRDPLLDAFLVEKVVHVASKTR
jgi:hypothetical protein